MNHRRKFLKSLVAVPALAAGCVTVARQPITQVRSVPISKDVPRNVIHLVVDGMGSGMLACANQYSEQVRGRRLAWFDLVDRTDISQCVMDVRSQNSLVTDSSASSCAWGSGVRIPNGKVNQDSDGRKLVTLYELLGLAGWKRGLVTTTEITHATPSGFIACVGSRDHGEDIAAQYLERRVEVALGGARNHFRADKRKDKRDLHADFRTAGYAVLQKPSDLASAPLDQPWLGTFADGHLPYLVDVRGGITKPEAAPTLAQMAKAALRKLAREDRFILQVEGGRVDHGCHANDIAAALLEFIGFDEAIEACLGFQRERPDTLIVITTDHATGNPGLNGMGDHYGKSNASLRNVRHMRQSAGEIIKRLQTSENRDQMIARLKESTGYTASARRMELLEPFLKKKGHALFDGFNSESSALGLVLANHLGVGFTGSAHTSDYVPLLAAGPGADRFRGFIRNTEVFGHYLEFAGVQFRNPQEPLVAMAAHVAETEDTESYWRV